MRAVLIKKTKSHQTKARVNLRTSSSVGERSLTRSIVWRAIAISSRKTTLNNFMKVHLVISCSTFLWISPCLRKTISSVECTMRASLRPWGTSKRTPRHLQVSPGRHQVGAGSERRRVKGHQLLSYKLLPNTPRAEPKRPMKITKKKMLELPIAAKQLLNHPVLLQVALIL